MQGTPDQRIKAARALGYGWTMHLPRVASKPFLARCWQNDKTRPEKGVDHGEQKQEYAVARRTAVERVKQTQSYLKKKIKLQGERNQKLQERLKGVMEVNEEAVKDIQSQATSLETRVRKARGLNRKLTHTACQCKKASKAPSHPFLLRYFSTARPRYQDKEFSKITAL